MRLAYFGVPALLACCGVPVAAQTAAQDSAARFLEVWLSALNPEGDSVRIRIGQPTPRLVGILGRATPVQVLGSVSHIRGGTTIFWSDAPAALGDSTAAALAERGWVPREPPAGMFARRGMPQPRVLCGGDSLAIVLGVSRNGDHLVASLMSDADQLCDPDETLVGPMLHPERPRIPSLVNARTVGEKRGARAWEWYWALELETELSLMKVFSHYVEALVVEGWDVGDPASSEALIAAPVLAPGPQEITWSGILVVSAGTEPNRVTIRMTLDPPQH